MTLITIVVVMAVVSTGCDHDDPDPPTPRPRPSPTATTPLQTSPPPTLPRPTATTGQTVDIGCTATFPDRLPVSTNVRAELPYLDQVRACTRRAQDATLLVNNSEVAWTVSSNPGGAAVAQLTDGLELTSFRDAAARVTRFPVLAPKSSVRIDARPAAVEWTLAPGLSAMWLAHEQLAETVREYGQEQLTELLASGLSLRRRAMVTCSVGAYNVAGEAGTALNGASPARQLLAGLGIAAAGTECAVAWKQADADALRRFRTTATWDNDVAGLARQATFLRAADDQLSILHRLGKALLLLRG